MMAIILSDVLISLKSHAHTTGALANLGYHPHTENTCRSQGSVGMGLNSIECSKLVTAGKLTIPSEINISPSVLRSTLCVDYKNPYLQLSEFCFCS